MPVGLVVTGGRCLLGVPLNDIFQTLQTYLGSSYVNLFNKFNQSFQVRVQADAQFRRCLDDIANLYVANKQGEVVPLGALLATICIRRRTSLAPRHPAPVRARR